MNMRQGTEGIDSGCSEILVVGQYNCLIFTDWFVIHELTLKRDALISIRGSPFKFCFVL